MGGFYAPHSLFTIQEALQQVEWSFGETAAFEDRQTVVIDHHREYLARHGGARPKKHSSYRILIRPAELTGYRDEWSGLESRLQDDAWLYMNLTDLSFMAAAGHPPCLSAAAGRAAVWRFVEKRKPAFTLGAEGSELSTSRHSARTLTGCSLSGS